MKLIGKTMTLPSSAPTRYLPANGGLETGSTVGLVYRIVGLIGRGGMGNVYEAEHLRLGRRFAIKVLRDRFDRAGIDRFQRELRAIARIESEHVVTVLDSGELDDNTPYLVMERLQGEDLRRLLDRSGPLPIPRAAGILQQACWGVAAAHRAQVVHRDLKPENLFVVPREMRQESCKVVDFGVARLLTSESTQHGVIVGTLKYIAPEQLADGGRVGPAADIYALGAILYECLANAPPHTATTVQETMFRIMTATPTPIRESRPEVPLELARVIERALARNPADRFNSAEELASALEPFAFPASAQLVRRSSSDGETRQIERVAFRPSRTMRGVQVLSLLLLGAVFGSAFGWLAAARRAHSPPPTLLQSEAKLHSGQRLPLERRAEPAASDPIASSETEVTRPTTPPVTLGTPSHVARSSPAVAASLRSRTPKVSFERQNPYAP